MKITIGETIKRLRREKDITQEALSELLGVSCAAVSKWERGETYPDITLIFPLASFFNVSVDELMGYHSARMEEEIDKIFDEHRRLFRAGKTEEHIALMKSAKQKFPGNYRILSQYMLDLAGGYADNDPAVLLSNKAEISDACDRILDGCTEQSFRLNAWNMKAKLLHAEGKTEEALGIYREQFPDWYQTVGQKSEQLFAKDTPEFHKCLLDNMIELSCFAANKKLKEIWYCKGYSIDEKAKEGIRLGDAVAKIREQYGYAELCRTEYEILNDHVWKMTFFGAKMTDIADGLEKLLAAAARCDELIDTDEVFRNAFLCPDGRLPHFLQRKVMFYLTTAHPKHAALRNDPACAAILEAYRAKLS